VGGVSPYLAIHGRSGASREAMDKSVADSQIHELPSARGCTYVLPQEQFALGLLMAQGNGEPQEIALIKKHFGVTQAELDKLRDAVLPALEKGALDPAEIKDAVGDRVRSLGEEGKKRGVSSTLPPVLGWLQTSGFIRRVPVNGRLDQQRYKYVLWKPNPLEACGLTREEALAKVANLYFQWIGPASLAEFRQFAGLNGKAAKEAVAGIGLVAVEDLWILPAEADLYASFKAALEPSYKLLGRIDPILNLVSGDA
jgi:Winged helix DNA-binding domain